MIFKILHIKKLKIRYQKIEEIKTSHLNQQSLTTLPLLLSLVYLIPNNMERKKCWIHC